MAKNLGRTTAQLAINWLINRKGVTTVLVGVKNPSQIEQNTGAVGWKIPEDDLNRISNILEERRD